MYRFITINGVEKDTYRLFVLIGFAVLLISSLFFFKSKRNVIGLHSKRIILFAYRVNVYLGKIVEIVLASIESFLMAYAVDIAASGFNWSFGEFVGTGANYFGLLLMSPFFWIILCLIFMVNPLKQMDITTLSLPLYLFFVKIACFLNGCCWGIPWEYGPYNHHPDHPGNQVPVQAIEAFYALAIFVFLLWYRKRAKTGTVFPMYMILYGATRFFSEFFKDDYGNVLGPLKMYHILCLVSIAYGIQQLVFMHFLRDSISDFFDKRQETINLEIAEYEKKYNEVKERRAKEKQRENKNKKMYAKSRRL